MAPQDDYTTCATVGQSTDSGGVRVYVYDTLIPELGNDFDPFALGYYLYASSYDPVMLRLDYADSVFIRRIWIILELIERIVIILCVFIYILTDKLRFQKYNFTRPPPFVY